LQEEFVVGGSSICSCGRQLHLIWVIAGGLAWLFNLKGATRYQRKNIVDHILSGAIYLDFVCSNIVHALRDPENLFLRTIRIQYAITITTSAMHRRLPNLVPHYIHPSVSYG
jgi:hypothetical protein